METTEKENLARWAHSLAIDAEKIVSDAVTEDYHLRRAMLRLASAVEKLSLAVLGEDYDAAVRQ